MPAPIHRLLQQSCTHYSEHIAIECDRRQISYAELSQLVEPLRKQLAQLLPEGGVVAVVGHRSLEVIVASWSVWLSGLTLMLIDDSLPPDRQALMSESVPPDATIDCHHVNGIVVRATGHTLPFWQRVQTAEAPPQGDRAYIAFTSGSTGRPKAILGSHVGLSHFLLWQRDEFRIAPGDRFAHLTNLSFDVWFRDAFTPLISGATLCIPEALHLGAAELFEMLEEQAITTLHVVPSVANHWIHSAPPRTPINVLRLAFFAGEPLEGVLVRRWAETFPACQVVNLYGPTETTLAKHCKLVSSQAPDGVQSVGRPIPGAATYILDEQLIPCADGTQGEICIETPYRSHGYLSQQGLVTPFMQFELPGQKPSTIYRTGDIGLRNADGEIEILGRKDDQVKINGVRIELLEIKSLIASWPGVRDVFVCVVQEQQGKAIVAVVESHQALAEDITSLLRQKLPAMMVPSRILFKPALPRLPNGKINRASLQALAASLPTLAAVSPRTIDGPPKDRLTRIWRDLLGQRPIEHSSNFFESGGNSLSIVELHARIERTFKIRLPLVRLFEHSSVMAQAALIAQLLGGEEASTRAGADGSGPQQLLRARTIAARKRAFRRSDGPPLSIQADVNSHEE